jgi:hypothetical protein
MLNADRLRISAGRLPVESLAELWRLSGLSGADDDAQREKIFVYPTNYHNH